MLYKNFSEGSLNLCLWLLFFSKLTGLCFYYLFDALGKQKRDTTPGYLIFCTQHSMEGVVWKGWYWLAASQDMVHCLNKFVSWNFSNFYSFCGRSILVYFEDLKTLVEVYLPVSLLTRQTNRFLFSVLPPFLAWYGEIGSTYLHSFLLLIFNFWKDWWSSWSQYGCVLNTNLTWKAFCKFTTLF